jgi:hypothetical protein
MAVRAPSVLEVVVMRIPKVSAERGVGVDGATRWCGCRCVTHQRLSPMVAAMTEVSGALSCRGHHIIDGIEGLGEGVAQQWEEASWRGHRRSNGQ